MKKQKTTKDIRFLKVCALIENISDCEINDVDNGDFANLPPNVTRSHKLELIIDILDGRVINWDNNHKLKTYFELSDESSFGAYDADFQELNTFKGDVPKILQQDIKAFDNCMYVTIQPSGKISKWLIDEQKTEELLTRKR